MKVLQLISELAQIGAYDVSDVYVAIPLDRDAGLWHAAKVSCVDVTDGARFDYSPGKEESGEIVIIYMDD